MAVAASLLFRELMTNICRRPLQFNVTWRHRARDHLIPQVRFLQKL